MSTLTKEQFKTFTKRYTNESGASCTLVVTIRHDDQCGNGHNTFSVTADLREGRGQSCGCLHEEIAQRMPELASYIKWHLCSTDGPLHYVPNTVYHASNRDCWGLRKGEFRQSIDKQSGLPIWELSLDDMENSHGKVVRLSETEPGPTKLKWKPLGRIGEGKERDLDAARRSAIWPDATDDELTAPRLKERLQARLPALLAEFRAAVESLGLTY